jgi:hypothetical protein
MHGTWEPDSHGDWGYFAFHLADKEDRDELFGYVSICLLSRL